MSQNWHDLMRVWNVAPQLAAEIFADLVERYTGPSRFYHTLDHIRKMLETVDALGRFARNLNAVKLAVWLHDAIYDSRASDNEQHSAEYADRFCRRAAIPEREAVMSLIAKTKTHNAEGDVDAQVLLDADLAILGADEGTYREYAEWIRREYAWVPDAEYRVGRCDVLRSFLSRPRIFEFLTQLEGPARRNVAAEIAGLALPRHVYRCPDARTSH